ncbi:germinal center-associated signaling and motility protein [Neophocaena asiaeorientalis asiaeorientalis]|uniref:Germinal center-associated signaling and motility protein n=1 Tax=Neophocaena asiaeorientalis asiaeorientalis TaxID=1706337 RepID=A0A341AKC4_NEOAA|nr:germinal center-associated signaling and motility protein [Neophocaena asiaeorientalis asiaeorientalis]
MGNSLLRENSFGWQQISQETPWNLRNQSPKQRTSRCWDCHIADGCFCLPWKKMHIFKVRQDSPKQNEETSSAPIQQEEADQGSSEDLCYTLINHSVLGKRPSGNAAEGCYENVSLEAERPRESLDGNGTEYSLLRVPSAPRRPSSPEDEYKLLMPSRIFSDSLI